MKNGPTSPPALDYLKSVIQMNPLSEADLIVGQRNAFLRPRHKDVSAPGGVSASAATADLEDLSELREATRIRIKAIRAEFWNLEQADLGKRIAGLKVDRFPELKVAAQRLAKVAKLRPRFAQLAGARPDDGDLFRVLKQAAVLSTREAGPLKERFLRQIRRKRDLKRHRKMARYIQDEFPDVYELEVEFLSMLNHFEIQKAAKPAKQSEESSWLSGWWWKWWFVFIFIRMIARAFSE